MDKKKVLWIMPFQDNFLNLKKDLQKVFSEYDFQSVDQINSTNNIMRDVVSSIYDADVIIAELSGLNSNVMYELGLAHALRKKVIMITNDISELPFDLRSYRAIEYKLDYKSFEQFVQNLKDRLNLLNQDGESAEKFFGNPVIDFADPNVISNQQTRFLEKVEKSPRFLKTIEKPKEPNAIQNTIVVPTKSEGFNSVFIEEKQWYAISISEQRAKDLKYIAAYRTAPYSKITHVAEIEKIVPMNDNSGKKRIIFKDYARELDNPIVLGKDRNALQSKRYTNYSKLFTSKNIDELLRR